MIDRLTVQRLMQFPNVVAVGEGYKRIGGVNIYEKAIVVSVIRKVPRLQLKEDEIIPETVDDMPTDVVQTGIIKALDIDRTAYMRPVPCGVSWGHGNITAGTGGCLVSKDGKVYALSNNQIFANSNDASIGDKIYQPGPYDIKGAVTDEYLIAHLTDYIPIDFGDTPDPSPCPIAGNIVRSLNAIAKAFRRESRILPPIKIKAKNNLVDAAIARPISLTVVDANILGIGMLTGIAEVDLGEKVYKSGRTTAVTDSVVSQINVTCRVQYGEGKIAIFEDQVMAGAMSKGGDSGSAVLNSLRRFVGVLFAGSDNTTVFNRVQNVVNELGLEGVV